MLLRLEIVGPTSVAPGETIQYRVTGHFSDGSNQDVTSQAGWQTSNGSVLSMDSNGRATGQAIGESNLVAQVRQVRSTTEVVVVPPDTYRLVAVVREAGSVVLEGVRVEVLEGRGAGLSTMTRVDGRYVLYGVAGNVVVRVSGRGYREHIERLNVMSHTSMTIELVTDRPRASLEGDYTLTITADPSCHSLPADVRTRRYSARLTQAGPEVWVTLSGADFLLQDRQANTFGGRLDADSSRIVFNLAAGTSYYYYYPGFSDLPDVAERLQGTEYLSYTGGALVSVTEIRLSGFLDGVVRVLEVPRSSPVRWTASCRARHGFELTR
jgi:hypothetical protein